MKRCSISPMMRENQNYNEELPHTRQQASLVAQAVKNLPAMWEAWVKSLGWKDPLKKGMATHSSILAWRIPWTEKPDMVQDCKELDMTE